MLQVETYCNVMQKAVATCPTRGMIFDVKGMWQNWPQWSLSSEQDCNHLLPWLVERHRTKVVRY